jgi:hypothetical protein
MKQRRKEVDEQTANGNTRMPFPPRSRTGTGAAHFQVHIPCSERINSRFPFIMASGLMSAKAVVSRKRLCRESGLCRFAIQLQLQRWWQSVIVGVTTCSVEALVRFQILYAISHQNLIFANFLPKFKFRHEKSTLEIDPI